MLNSPKNGWTWIQYSKTVQGILLLLQPKYPSYEIFSELIHPCQQTSPNIIAPANASQGPNHHIDVTEAVANDATSSSASPESLGADADAESSFGNERPRQTLALNPQSKLKERDNMITINFRSSVFILHLGPWKRLSTI